MTHRHRMERDAGLRAPASLTWQVLLYRERAVVGLEAFSKQALAPR